MGQPKVFLAYAPRGIGLRCAVAYLASGADVYGWFVEPCEDTSVARRYFLIENLHAAELQAYAEAELAAGDVNVRFARLSRFDTTQPKSRWPLEYRLHGDDDRPRRRAAGPRP